MYRIEIDRDNDLIISDSDKTVIIIEANDLENFIDDIKKVQEIINKPRHFSIVVSPAEPKYLYDNIADFENSVGYEVNESFKSGFMMARILKAKAGSGGTPD